MIDFLLGAMFGAALNAAAMLWWLSRPPRAHGADQPRHPSTPRSGRWRVETPDGRPLPRCQGCGAHVADWDVHALWCQRPAAAPDGWSGEDFDA